MKEKITIDTDDFPISLRDHSIDNCSDNQQRSPIEAVYQHVEQEDV